MKDLTLLIEITRRMETQLVRAVLSSWLFSTLAIIIQYGDFDTGFSTLVTITGGVAGTAAVLSVYMRRLQHPAFMADSILRDRPHGGLAVILFMLTSAVSFFFYYSYVTQSNEICVLFFGLGTFLFFYTLSDAASRMLVNEQQKVLWQSMEPEERWKWRQKNDPEVIRLQQEIEAYDRILANSPSDEELDRLATIKANETIAQRKRLEEAKQRRSDATYPLRKRFGLVSEKEKGERKLKAWKKEDEEKLWWDWSEGLHEQNAAKIINLEVKPITLEGSGLQVYEFGEYYKYFVIREQLNQACAQWHLEALKTLGEPKHPLYRFVAGIILPGVEVTFEARKLLETSGVTLYQYGPPAEAEEKVKEATPAGTE